MAQLKKSRHKLFSQFLDPHTIEETYTLVMQEALSLTKTDEGLLLLHSDGVFINVYGTNKNAASYIPLKRGLEYRFFHNTKPFIVAGKELTKIYPDLSKINIQAIIEIPLVYNRETFGMVITRSYKKKYKLSTEALSLLEIFNVLASLIIRNSILEGEAKNVAHNRDTFISITSHEMRTPLTSIHGYIQLLTSRIQKFDPAEAKWIQELAKETKRLINMIDDLLQISRIHSQKLQYILEEYKATSLISEAIASIQSQYPRRIIRFHSSVKETQDTIICDYGKMVQVFMRILHNAIKFSPSDTPIDVTLKSNASYLKVTIKDSGIGIKKDELSSVFNQFYKGTQSGEGMGVGLFLAQNIVNHHHGSIRIRSKPNKGTTVEVKLKKARG